MNLTNYKRMRPSHQPQHLTCRTCSSMRYKIKSPVKGYIPGYATRNEHYVFRVHHLILEYNIFFGGTTSFLWFRPEEGSVSPLGIRRRHEHKSFGALLMMNIWWIRIRHEHKSFGALLMNILWIRIRHNIHPLDHC